MNIKNTILSLMIFCMVPSFVSASSTRTRRCTGTLIYGMTLKIGNQTRRYNNIVVPAAKSKVQIRAAKYFRRAPIDPLMGDTGIMEAKRAAREAIRKCYLSSFAKRSPGIHKDCKNTYSCSNRLFSGQKCIARNSSRSNTNTQVEELVVPNSREKLSESLRKRACGFAYNKIKSRRLSNKSAEISGVWVKTKIVCPGRTVRWNVPIRGKLSGTFHCKWK